MNDDNLDSFRGSEYGEGVSPERDSKTHLAMKGRDLRNLENKVKDHIKTK
jgi:hypothetical protein